jgi:hypothetical protein
MVAKRIGVKVISLVPEFISHGLFNIVFLVLFAVPVVFKTSCRGVDTQDKEERSFRVE